MSKSIFAYHLTHVFGAFELDSYHTNSEKAYEGDTIYVISGDNDEENAGKDYYLEGIFKIKRKVHGPFNLQALNKQSKRFEYKLLMERVKTPDKPIPLKIAEWYSREDVHRYFSSGQNFNTLRQIYRDRFDNLLSGYSNISESELAQDLLELENSDIQPTQREILSMARIGQGKFRQDVTEAWGNGETCALTGINLPELLIASHIKPWRESNNKERLQASNGLLLATHIDKLFDRYLISFYLENGNFYLSMNPKVVQTLNSLNVNGGAKLRSSRLGLNLTTELTAFLQGHYQKFLKLKENNSSTVTKLN